MKKVKLTSVCRPKQWKTIPTSELRDVGYPVYGANGVIGYYDSYNHEQETVVITCRGATCGTVNLTHPRSYVTGNAMCLDNVDDSVDIKYLFYSMQAYDFSKVISGTAQPQITREGLEKVEFVLHSLDVQREIVCILDKTDTLIEKRRLQLEKLEELVKSRFIELFGTSHDNKKGFAVVTIEEVCSLIKDGTHQTPQYTENKEEGYKFLSSKDVMSQKIDWTEIKYIPAELHEKLYASVKPQRNDILMSKNGVNYGVAAVNDTDEVFDIYVSLALLRPKQMIDPVFFRCVINNPETKRQFDSSIKGIGVPNLHLGEIKKTKIILPPMELQKEFVSFVAQVDKSKHFSELEVAA